LLIYKKSPVIQGFFYIFDENNIAMSYENGKKGSNTKNAIIALFTIEQVVIIYIIATRKGMSVVDWFASLF